MYTSYIYPKNQYVKGKFKKISKKCFFVVLCRKFQARNQYEFLSQTDEEAVLYTVADNKLAGETFREVVFLLAELRNQGFDRKLSGLLQWAAD